MIIYLGGKNVLGQGWQAWNLAAFSTYLAYFGKLAVKSSHAASLFNAVQKAEVSWHRIKPLLNQEAAPAKQLAKSGDLQIKDLAFSWDQKSASIADNITLGQKEDLTLDQVLGDADLTPDLREMPNGADTEVGGPAFVRWASCPCCFSSGSLL